MFARPVARPLALFLVVASALLLTGNPFSWHKSGARQAVGFALLTGFTISVYTITDKASVAAWLIPPLVYDWGCNFFRSLVLVPLTQRRWPGSIGAAWRERRKTVVAIALMSPLSYILVLTALVFTPVSLVAPAREVSILFAALLGAHFLKEGARFPASSRSNATAPDIIAPATKSHLSDLLGRELMGRYGDYVWSEMPSKIRYGAALIGAGGENGGVARSNAAAISTKRPPRRHGSRAAPCIGYAKWRRGLH